MPLQDKYLSLLCDLSPEVEWNEKKRKGFSALFDRLLLTNARLNVTSLTSPMNVVLKHFADSLTLIKSPLLLEYAGEGRTFCDVGCGGGFPGLPLALSFPDLPLTMIDSTEKKIVALNENAKALGLTHVTPLCGRGEDLSRPGREYREAFDAVVSRAVAPLPVLAELCLPFVKEGGVFVAMKGARAPEEVEAARRAVGQMGGAVPDLALVSFPSPGLDTFSAEEQREAEEILSAARFLVVIRKTRPTPDLFPRTWAQMTKKPL